MQKQEVAPHTGGRGFNVVRGLFANQLAGRAERRAQKLAHAMLFTQFGRLFAENPDRAEKLSPTKQTMELSTGGAGKVILERSTLYQRHHIHHQNAAYSANPDSPDAQTNTIRLSRVGAEIVPRKFRGGDSLDWPGNPSIGESTRLTSVEATNIYDWLEVSRLELESERGEPQAEGTEAALA